MKLVNGLFKEIGDKVYVRFESETLLNEEQLEKVINKILSRKKMSLDYSRLDNNRYTWSTRVSRYEIDSTKDKYGNFINFFFDVFNIERPQEKYREQVVITGLCDCQDRNPTHLYSSYSCYVPVLRSLHVSYSASYSRTNQCIDEVLRDFCDRLDKLEKGNKK